MDACNGQGKQTDGVIPVTHRLASLLFFSGGDRVAREFAEAFYHSAAWKRAKRLAMQLHYGVCEKCGRPAKIVHHKIWLTPDNITDHDIALGLDNLMVLCADCHNRIHAKDSSVREGLEFDGAGQLVKMQAPLFKSAGRF